MSRNQPIEFIEYAFIYQPKTKECGLFRYWENAYDGNFWFEAMDGQLLPGCAEYWDVCEHDLTPEQIAGIVVP